MVICCHANKSNIKTINEKYTACDVCPHSIPHECYQFLYGDTCTKWGICDLTGDGEMIKVRCIDVNKYNKSRGMIDKKMSFFETLQPICKYNTALDEKPTLKPFCRADRMIECCAENCPFSPVAEALIEINIKGGVYGSTR